ncbi:3-deoxy-manno-octulosonate cytidylyltransferase [Methanoplanus limicola]|uniref:3-deoxy-manno-octulosonate cytidylyltransferase n=1 Tax=Methanoplanus limicola DSM 2279 TaxID=937775 RepID=H1YXD1_9EURY|nr:3-deoxy-manno-octulosonate cytidylyltransferase [Methanoplanus limicola]EHQ36868.1 3-deoxy-manno-octulosonate cytidylyltransferase [Methanoplanus limicola DSM 2279]
MKIVGIIPARMGSSRFQGKPLVPICGKPMIEHVYRRSAMSLTLDDLYVATCDQEIYETVREFGGKAIMTSNCHERCTDRIAQAVENIEADIIVNIQGDEPLIFPEMIDQALEPLLSDSAIVCSNLMADINNEKDFEDPNEVKVVVDLDGFALYFSREPIPSRKKGSSDFVGLKQVCIIPFRRDFLFKYTKLSPTPLEIIESVDMLRAIEHGYKVKMVKTPYETYSVDTIEDLMHVEEIMKDDELFRKYS